MAIVYRFGSSHYAAVSTCHIGLNISRSASDVSKKVNKQGHTTRHPTCTRTPGPPEQPRVDCCAGRMRTLSRVKNPSTLASSVKNWHAMPVFRPAGAPSFYRSESREAAEKRQFRRRRSVVGDGGQLCRAERRREEYIRRGSSITFRNVFSLSLAFRLGRPTIRSRGWLSLRQLASRYSAGCGVRSSPSEEPADTTREEYRMNTIRTCPIVVDSPDESLYAASSTRTSERNSSRDTVTAIAEPVVEVVGPPTPPPQEPPNTPGPSIY